MPVGERKLGPIAVPSRESVTARTTWTWLTWGAGSGGFHVAAHLVSLHCDGPSVTCATPPPPGRQVEFLLEVAGEPELTATVTVTAVRALGRGVYLVRLMFAEPCKPAFWDAASACLEAVE